MPAAIDTTDGVSNAVFYRDYAWHGLGTVVTEEITDYLKFLQIGRLAGWNVRLVPFQGIGRGGKQVFEVVRDNPTDGGIDRIGVVGQRYTPVQNEAAFAFLQSLNDGSRWETAGSLDNGSVVFGSIAFERETVLDPNGVSDVTKTFVLVYTSHDGSTGICALITPTRVVCKNTLGIAISGAKNTIKIKHTKSVEEKMAEAAEVFRATHSYMDNFDREAEAFFKAAVTDDQYTDMVVDMLGKPKDDASKTTKTVFERNLEKFTGTWKAEHNAGIRGTAWGAWNALTEANQWDRQVRGDNLENYYAAGAGFDAPTNKFRQESFNLVKGLFVPA